MTDVSFDEKTSDVCKTKCESEKKNIHTESHQNSSWNTEYVCIYVCIYTCFIFLSILSTPPHLFFRPKLLRGNVSHGGQHGNSAMLKLSLATSLEVLNTAISGKACWIPKSRWRLNAQLVLECGSHNLRSKCLQNTKLFFCPKKTFLDTLNLLSPVNPTS